MEPADSTPAPGTPPGPPIPPERWEAVEQATTAQRKMLHLTMGALVVVLFTSSMALFHQIRWLRTQAEQLNATAFELRRVVGDYETNTLPQIDRLFDDLKQFCRAHPSFTNVLAKYRFVNEPAASTNPPPATPPAPARQAPK